MILLRVYISRVPRCLIFGPHSQSLFIHTIVLIPLSTYYRHLHPSQQTVSPLSSHCASTVHASLFVDPWLIVVIFISKKSERHFFLCHIDTEHLLSRVLSHPTLRFIISVNTQIDTTFAGLRGRNLIKR